MSAVETVKVTIDGREVEVAKGLGLVEAAAAAGVEIPVFCYEPRLGPPVGACRMCLVEVEGVPKLQAGCTLTAQDGMVVRTAADSAKAAEGQNATLEFILVNHPLDCPVCDKGGECPLQDLTFRYGPGQTRMTFPKRTFDKPIPISPTIALDRERCILCYRCTRFSSDVAEDGQLVAKNRGAQSMIATFEDEAYTAPFTGNVIELCPVGALTSTQYRFEARPWEIQNVPTVCGLCPVGCNVSATTREGKVKRIISRNHPEVDEGWLCDKGRFAYPHLYARDRIVDPLERVRRQGFGELSWDDALDRAEALLRGAEGRIVTALSGSETVEQAYALGKLLRQGLGAHSAVLPEAVSHGLDAFRAPLSTIGAAEIVVVVGDEQVADRAPIVDLWIRQARRNGAEVVQRRRAEARQEARGAGRGLRPRRPDLVRPRRRRRRPAGGARPPARARREARLRRVPPAGDPERARRRRRLGRVLGRGRGESGADRPADRLGRRRGGRSGRARARRAGGERDRDHDVPGPRRRLGRPRPARARATSSATARSSTSRAASSACAASVIPPVPDELAWIAKLAERFDVELSPHAALVFEELSARCFGGIPFGAVGERAPLPDRAPYVAPEPAPSAPVPAAEAEPPEHFLGTLRLQRYRPLFSGPAVERVPELQFQRPEAEIELAYDDAQRRQIATGDEVSVRSNGTSLALARARQPRARRRHRPDRRRARRRAPSRRRGGEGDVNEPWWVSVIKSVIIINLVMAAFAYLTLVERKVMGRMQLRYGPNRAGPFGLLQPIADLMKLIRKESFFPGSAVDVLYIFSPFVAAFTALTTFAVIPFGPGWEIGGVQVDGEVADVPIALILIFAIGSVGIYGFIVGGWASDSKYALLGAMRTCAQLVSYEVSLALSVLGVVLMAQSLSLTEIVAAQDGWWYIVPQFVGFVIFMFAGTAETARAPFDLPEAEQELVAGYHTEYGGMRFGLFTMSEYINLITLSALAVTLFLGGWHFPVLEGLGPLWFVLKLIVLLFIFIWMRTTLPRLRYDQLMRFGWKVLLPVATINAVVTAILVVWICSGARHRQGLRRHLPPDLQEADHAGVPGVQAAGLSALPRPAQAAHARERAREVRRLLALRRRLPGRLHPRRPGREHARPTASRRASATRASTRST